MDAISELKALSIEIEQGYEEQAAEHRVKLTELRARIEAVEAALLRGGADGPASSEG